MLSQRGARTAAQLDIPWRFAPRGKGLYDPATNPEGIISFATAENPLVHQDLEDFVRDKVHIPAAAFSYSYSTSGGPRLPKALAAHLNEYFKPLRPLTGDEIQITGTATALHEILGFSLAEPGDGILTSRPCYGRFELDFGNKAGLQMVYANTDAETSLDADVVAKFEEALAKSNAAGVKIRALLIVNPNNPLGRCYPKETLLRLVGFCQKHRIHLISDEVYGLSVFDSGEPDTVPFTSVLSVFDPAAPAAAGSCSTDPDLIHVTYALSKDFGAAGLRIGALVTRNRLLQRAVAGIMRFANPSGPSVAVATAMLEDRVWCRAFVATARGRIAAAYKLVSKGLRDVGVRWYDRGVNAGFFVLIDLERYLPPPESSGVSLSVQEREFALAQKVFDAGVFLHPGEEHALRPGQFRLVYTQKPEAVREGLKRLKTALDQVSW